MKVKGSLAVLLVATSGCFAPPALLPAKDPDLSAVLPEYPTGTQTVSVEVEPGVCLRGVFVPSDTDAPIVLHLLESSGSCAAQKLHFGQVTRQLADLGFASLILDYTGVGASQGDASVRHLERDAAAMWQEATRRAGNESRVYLRATSLGAIPTALLLKQGARPAGIVLIGPVLADSATERFARAFHGRIAGWAAAALFRDIADVDVAAELGKAKVRTIAITAHDDVLLLMPDRQRFAVAFYQGKSRLVVRPGGHLQLCLEAHSLLPEEAAFFQPCSSEAAIAARIDRVLQALPDSVAQHFPADSDARRRLERLVAVQINGDPLAIAAAAIAIPRAGVATRLLWLIAQSPYPPLDFDELCAVLSLQDPAGELPIDLIESASRPRDLSDQYGGMRRILNADEIARATLENGLHSGDLSWSTWAEFSEDQSVKVEHDSARVWQALLDRGLSEEDVARQYMRIHLKAHRIPDRLQSNEEAKPMIEIKGEDGWTVLDPAALPPVPAGLRGTMKLR